MYCAREIELTLGLDCEYCSVGKTNWSNCPEASMCTFPVTLKTLRIRDIDAPNSSHGLPSRVSGDMRIYVLLTDDTQIMQRKAHVRSEETCYVLPVCMCRDKWIRGTFEYDFSSLAVRMHGRD